MRWPKIVMRGLPSLPAGGMAALMLLGGAGDIAHAADAPGPPAEASEPSLPDAPPPVGPLRRGANGQIEVINPATATRSGARLCDAGALCVGKGQTYRSLAAALAAARPGGTIEVVGGTYAETAALGVENLTVRGVAGRPHFDCAGLRVTQNKGCLVIAAPGITLENLEISGAAVSADMGANGACIRAEPGTTFTLRDIVCHGSQEGILSVARSALIENSEFYDNGWNGLTHNAYFSTGCDSVIVRGSIFRDARVGHEFKSRCRQTEISDSTFRSTKGSRDLDIPDGGNTLVYRSTLLKTAGSQSVEIVGFTAESCRYPADMVLKDVHIVNSQPDAVIHNFDRCRGHAIVLNGVTFEGLPVKDMGFILKQ